MPNIFKKAALVVSGLACRTYVPFVLLGAWNRVFGGWRSVFFCYGGNAQYQRAYSPGRIAEGFRWVPSPIGVLKQGEARGLVLASLVTEQDFLNPSNVVKFDRLLRRMHRIAWCLGVPQINMAGILPSVLRDRRDLSVNDGRDITVDLILSSAERLVGERFAGVWPLIIVLGGAGFIGSRLVEVLQTQGREVSVVDLTAGAVGSLQRHMGQRALLIDVARAGVLQGYVPTLWPGLVVLNETFPEPEHRVQKAMAQAGVELWHLSGAQGQIWPDLPGAYAGAVPCCAVHDARKPLVPVLQQLTAPKVALAGASE